MPAQGINFVQDSVPNHVGAAHPWANDPPLPNWFDGTVAHRDLAKGNFAPRFITTWDGPMNNSTTRTVGATCSTSEASISTPTERSFERISSNRVQEFTEIRRFPRPWSSRALNSSPLPREFQRSENLTCFASKKSRAESTFRNRNRQHQRRAIQGN